MNTSLDQRQQTRLVYALHELESEAFRKSLPNGLRIFDAYITTPSPSGQYAHNAYIVITKSQPTIPANKRTGIVGRLFGGRKRTPRKVR